MPNEQVTNAGIETFEPSIAVDTPHEAVPVVVDGLVVGTVDTSTTGTTDTAGVVESSPAENMHPKAIAAREKAAADRLVRDDARKQAAQRRAASLEVIATLSKQHGLKFVSLSLNDGGATVAYAPTQPHSKIYKVANALYNPHDTYDKVYGKRVAAENFAAGRYVLVRNHYGAKNASALFDSMFGE